MTNKFEYNTIIATNADRDKIYFISIASEEEIQQGKYIELEDGLKISSNKKKFGMITNIGESNDK